MVLDLGCGNGILGIGCLLLGAKLVCAVDVDFSALEIATTNLGFNIHFVNQDVREFNYPCAARRALHGGSGGITRGNSTVILTRDSSQQQDTHGVKLHAPAPSGVRDP